MSILTVVQNVSLVVGLDKPDQVCASTDREMQEMVRLANEIADRLMKANDWQVLHTLNTFTGDAVTETFAIPTDYDRMVATAAMWSSKWTWAFNHIPDVNTWLEYQVVPYTFVNGNWIIYGNQFHFLPIMAVGETIKFFYISKNIVSEASDGSKKAAFTLDADYLRIDEKLLELGMIWQWRANKGLPYDEDMRNYELLLNKRMKMDAGSSPVVSGNRPFNGRRGMWAFPATVGQ